MVAPGDIPDNQVFVAVASPGGAARVKVPEGWARTEANGAVIFTDKYNSITIASPSLSSAPTPESMRSSLLSDVSTDPTFHLIDVVTVKRGAGTGVVATYEIASAANAVTGKKALLSVDRYVFSHNGIGVLLTLSGAKGADNVDPWRIVTDSVAWT